MRPTPQCTPHAANVEDARPQSLRKFTNNSRRTHQKLTMLFLPSARAQHGPMARLAFAEFEEFVEALRGVRGRYLPTMRSTREWQLHVLELDDATVMVGQG